MCAEGGTRTLTPLLILDFESSVSTNFTTSAQSVDWTKLEHSKTDKPIQPR